MNREWVLFHLREAQQELARTIADIEADPRYDVGELSVAVGHAYHHLNTAWNSRDEPESRVHACTDVDFLRWRQFPTDVYLGP